LLEDGKDGTRSFVTHQMAEMLNGFNAVMIISEWIKMRRRKSYR
jgi:hypothetical protein